MIPLLVITSILFFLTSMFLIYYIFSGYKNTVLSIVLACLAFISGTFAVTGFWSSRIGKLKMRDKIINELKLTGSENVLDVGCGRGLLTMGIAKRLTGGKVVGLDHWKSTFEYSYTRKMAEANIEAEGVGDKTEITDGDAVNLPFADNSFDIVTSSLALHHITDSAKAISEMCRVVKPGGIVAIADLPVPLFRNQIVESGLKILTVKPLTRLFFIRMRLIVAVK